MSDPFAEIQAAALRQQADERGAKALSEARARLVLGKDAQSVFFASLALRLKPQCDWSVDTAATDGNTLSVNPEWFAALPPAERVGVVAHEVMHCAMKHHARRGERDLRKWNIACDLAINQIIRDAGIALPSTGCFPGEGQFSDYAKGLSAEEYYSLLPQQPQQSSADPGGCGSVRDAGPDQASQQAAAADWQVAVAQASQAAQRRGTLPVGLGRLVEQALQPTVDWRSVLREFVRSYAKNDYSWSRPNRRYISQGIYLPSLHSERLGPVVIAVDTSGSIDQGMLDAFAAECDGILSAYDVAASIVYCDAEIQHVQQWRTSDGPLTMEARGGGGTSHVPVWDWLERQDEQPECVICLTDGMTDYGQDPGMPVIWCLTADAEPPFGQKVRITQ